MRRPAASPQTRWRRGASATLVFPDRQSIHVERTVLVSDDAIREAQRALWRVLRVVVEPGGAAALAAIISGAYKPAPGERVAVVIRGGNTAAVNFDATC